MLKIKLLWKYIKLKKILDMLTSQIKLLYKHNSVIQALGVSNCKYKYFNFKLKL